MKRFVMTLSMLMLASASGSGTQFQLEGTASVAGVVARAGTGAPIADAAVRLRRQGLPAPGDVLLPPVLTTYTDNAGRFAFSGVEPGGYALDVVGNGFVRQTYGQRAPRGPGETIAVAAGQNLTGLVFRLTPTGVVSGRITNERGEPLANAEVMLLRPVYDAGGQRTLQREVAAQTDDHGDYRLYHVTPGPYYLAAATPFGSSGYRPNQIPHPRHTTMFYPGFPDSEQAAIVEVFPGATRSEMNLRLQRQETFHIRGRMVVADGEGLRRVDILLQERTPGLSFPWNSGLGNWSNGRFELADVPVGSYWVRVYVLTPPWVGPDHTGIAAVDVVAGDVDDVTIVTGPGFTVEGRWAMESPAPDGNELSAVLVPAPGFEGIAAPRLLANLAGDGTFRVENAAPGEYRFIALPAPFYLKEARLGGVDILERNLSLFAPVSDFLNLVIGSTPGSASGIVYGPDGPMSAATVVFVPERQRARFDLYKTATASGAGRFGVEGLPPGDYRVFAWEYVDPYAWFDPQFLRQFETQGQVIHVGESSNHTVDLRAIPTDDRFGF